MPINVSNGLPAVKALEKENIFVISEEQAIHQDIRPLKIVILNLMPKKIETETQLLRLLSNSPLQVDIELMQMATHTSKNTSSEHLQKFYKTFEDIKAQKFDGMIITGAPVEQLEFEQVDYWDELTQIMEWSKSNVYSTFHICWGAQAGLYYHYNIKKYPLRQKMFGIFEHRTLNRQHPLLRGFDDAFYAPHSRHTQILAEEIVAVPQLELLSVSEQAGVYIVASRDSRQFFVTGHSEYDLNTLADEYFRDKSKNLPITIPVHYFPQDDPTRPPMYLWKSHGYLLFSNWLNYYVYQRTPYDLTNQF